MQHTNCRRATGTVPQVHAATLEASGVAMRSIDIRKVKDQRAALDADVTRIKTYPLLSNGLEMIGGIYQVENGILEKLF